MNRLSMQPQFFFISMLIMLFSPAVMSAPPFVQGQIAVYAAPYEIEDLEVVKWLPNAGISVLKVESGREWGQIQKLRKRGFKTGFNYIAQASTTPNDQFYPYQWHFPAVQSEQAWDISTGSDVVVAVLDTGLVANGSDGVNVCSGGGYDIVNNDSNPADGSSLSHGTHVAGTISQITSFDPTTSNTGVAGLAPGACIMPVKVLNDSGSGTFADIADGIMYAVNSGAQVINMSLGVNARYGITSDPLIDPALDKAHAADVTVVAASGNDGNRKNVSYPAIYPSVIAVGATDQRNVVTRYSNKGTGLDIVAPGGDTSRDDDQDGYSDGVLQETRYNGTWGYYFLQGTSMASPHVAAISALLISNGITKPNDVLAALTSTSKDLGEAGYDSSYGFGLVQAFDALNGLTIGPPGPPAPASNPFPSDNATAVSVNTTFSWLSGADTTTNQVYFGTNTLEFIGEQSINTYDPGPLQPDTLYQWQIIEVNDYGQTAGSVWTFTTESSNTQCIDADGDGFCAIPDGNDCDDTNSHVYPGHNDTKGRWGKDGLDNNCNGIIDG
ncbi:MAG: S8 family serine peptidase [Gammaproteobacteria bacterium]|nr:S8 family serine peptidase [Gammaproteobacteria bacterium]MDH5591780.1 S8 family serine peptidase [Gammaproteobacteria bacterium]